jgi:hypothetical protein
MPVESGEGLSPASVESIFVTNYKICLILQGFIKFPGYSCRLTTVWMLDLDIGGVSFGGF